MTKSRNKDEFSFCDIRTLRWMHTVLGLVLIAGGALKLHAFATAYQEDDVEMLLDALFSEANLFAGFWLVMSRDPVRARPWAVAILAGFWAASLYHGLVGSCSSGRFGMVSVNPWVVMIFDLIALALLLKWRPPRGDRAEAHLTALGMIALVVVALIVAAAGSRKPPLVSASGVAFRRGRPMADVTLTFRRYSVQLEIRTDGHGAFQLPPIRPGRYTVSTPADPAAPGLESDASARKTVKDTGRPPRKAVSRATQPPKASEGRDDVESLSFEIDQCARDGLTIDFR